MTTDAALEAFLAHPVGGEEPAKYVYGTQVVSPNWIRWNDSFHIFKTAFDLQQAKIDELGKKNYDLINELAERQKQVDELAKDAERWKIVELLWFEGSVELSTNDAGDFTISFEGAEVRDEYWTGIDQEAAIDQATAAIQQSTHTGG